VPQYATVELRALNPGMSDADLARATFVTRRSGHVVLRGLQDAGLITRPVTADRGRARPAHLTEGAADASPRTSPPSTPSSSAWWGRSRRNASQRSSPTSGSVATAPEE